MDVAVTAAVKWIAASSVFGSGMLFFAWMFFRERTNTANTHAEYDERIREITDMVIAGSEKQTEAIVRSTEALNSLRAMNERVLFDVTRSFTPARGVRINPKGGQDEEA